MGILEHPEQEAQTRQNYERATVARPLTTILPSRLSHLRLDFNLEFLDGLDEFAERLDQHRACGRSVPRQIGRRSPAAGGSSRRLRK